MSAYSSSLYTAQVSVPPRLPDAFLLGRALMRAYVTYTYTGAAAANDTINLCVLPADAVIIPHLCRVSHQGAGTTLTIALQDSAANTVAAAVDALTAGGINFANETLEVGLQSDGILVAKLATEAAVDAADVTQFEIVYTSRGAN